MFEHVQDGRCAKPESTFGAVETPLPTHPYVTQPLGCFPAAIQVNARPWVVAPGVLTDGFEASLAKIGNCLAGGPPGSKHARLDRTVGTPSTPRFTVGQHDFRTPFARKAFDQPFLVCAWVVSHGYKAKDCEILDGVFMCFGQACRHLSIPARLAAALPLLDAVVPGERSPAARVADARPRRLTAREVGNGSQSGRFHDSLGILRPHPWCTHFSVSVPSVSGRSSRPFSLWFPQ